MGGRVKMSRKGGRAKGAGKKEKYEEGETC